MVRALCFATIATQLSLGLGLYAGGTPRASAPVDSLGSYAPLNEEGYQSVASLRSDEEMKTFIRRLVENGARTVQNDAGLSGFAKFYSGAVMKQDLTRLKAELANPQVAWWIAEGLGKTAPLTDAGLERVSELGDHVQMKAFLRRIVRKMDREVADENLLESLVYELPCQTGAGCLRELASFLAEDGYTNKMEKVSVSYLPLTEAGYQRAAALKSNREMKAFVQRVLAAEGRSVKDDSGLGGFVPYYSGVEAVRDLETLKQELRQSKHAWWIDVGIGRKAPLTEEGFQRVVAARDSRQMKAFIRRLANPNGPMALDEGQLSGLVPFFSGQRGSPKFSTLKKELGRVQRQRRHAGHSPIQLEAGSDHISTALADATSSK